MSSTSNTNILFVQVDQLTASSLRIYDDSICCAPHLDHLAETGSVFEITYCNFPLCVPSRFSMAAGKLCSAIGAYDNGKRWIWHVLPEVLIYGVG